MQYLLMIYGAEEVWDKLGEAGQSVEHQAYTAFGREFATSIVGGNALQPIANATTVRMRDGKCLTTDGPFAETKEQLGGYYLVDASDLDQAIAMAAKIPGARYGSIEVRPILTFS